MTLNSIPLYRISCEVASSIEQEDLRKTSRQELAIIGIPIFYRRAAACSALFIDIPIFCRRAATCRAAPCFVY